MVKFIYRGIKKKLNNVFLSPSVKAVAALPGGGELSLLDIGAAGEVEPRWKPFSKFLNYIAVEPDERSRSSLTNNTSEFLSYRILPYALAERNEKLSFNLCKKPQVSSLYEPNTEFLSRFLDAKRFDVVRQISMDCVSLDSVDVPNFDFLKIDIQGAENDVLKGASSSMSRTLGLELEVEFIDLYKDQPLFGEVCKTLSHHDFEFIDFVSLHRWERDGHSAYGQCVFGDALFLKTPESMSRQAYDLQKWSAYFAILVVYRRLDLIEIALKKLPDEFVDAYENFRLTYSRVKNREKTIRKIHAMFSRLLSLVSNTHRSHFIQ